MNDRPLVSIGFPVYNGASRMRRALDSLLSQTYQNFELVISDNASTDTTGDLCREYMAKDLRIRYIRQTENIGQVPNFIFVLKEARGEYFMWANDDDWRAPEYIEELLSALITHPDHAVAQSSYQNIYEDGVIQNTVFLKNQFNLTENSYYSVLKKIQFDEPIHHFLHGLHRRERIVRFFNRPPPRCIRWDRVFMSEMALSTHFCSVDKLLFFKRATRTAIANRYSHDMVGETFREPLAYIRYYWLLFWRPLTSSVPPLRQKAILFLVWPQVLWRRKRSILKEAYRDSLRILRLTK
jgi:glycosyltransferase involved in cell wall biosynthesis